MHFGGVLAAYTLGAMYEVTVERVFRASHAITLTGQREETHEHEWRVRVVVGAQEVNHDGVLCDFHWLQRQLDIILAPLENQDLHEIWIPGAPGDPGGFSFAGIDTVDKKKIVRIEPVDGPGGPTVFIFNGARHTEAIFPKKGDSFITLGDRRVYKIVVTNVTDMPSVAHAIVFRVTTVVQEESSGWWTWPEWNSNFK